MILSVIKTIIYSPKVIDVHRLNQKESPQRSYSKEKLKRNGPREHF
jgi:hypothetical protein